MKEIRIDNSKQSAVKSGKWKNPGSSFYYKILNSFTIADPERSEEDPDRYDFDFRKVLQEAYLVAPVEKIKNSPYGITPYSQSGCKYPHHVIRNGKLVVSIPGIQAAYARAKQQGIYKGKVKEHIDRHYKEMGLTMSTITESVDPIQDQIDDNFESIQRYLEESLNISFVHPDVVLESTEQVDPQQAIQETFDWMDQILYQSDEEYNASLVGSSLFEETDPLFDLSSTIELNDDDVLRFRQIATAGMCPHGRGYKLNTLMARDFQFFGNDKTYMFFSGLNEKQALEELNLRKLDCQSYIQHLTECIQTKHFPVGYVESTVRNILYRYERQLADINDDLETISRDGYDVSIMEKYHESNDIDDMLFFVDPSYNYQAAWNAIRSFNEAREQSEDNDEDKTSEETTDDSPPNIELGDEELEPVEEPAEEPLEEEKPSEPVEEDTPAEDETEEDPKEDTTDEAPNIIEPTSLPKAADAQETDKNGVNRKKLYIAFIEWAKSYNARNTFGSLFDKDVFDVTYPFVPHEMRYFYRLANPILCVLSGKLTFFQVSELRKLNADNPDMKENDYRAFSTRDKRVYLAVDKPDGSGIQFTRALADSFDLYLQNMIGKGDILHGDVDSSTDSGTDRGDHSDENGE